MNATQPLRQRPNASAAAAKGQPRPTDPAKKPEQAASAIQPNWRLGADTAPQEQAALKPPWQAECESQGMTPGDEQLRPLLGGKPLVDAHNQFNLAGIHGAPHIPNSIATLSFVALLIQQRNDDLPVKRQVTEATQDLAAARQQLAIEKDHRAPESVLSALQSKVERQEGHLAGLQERSNDLTVKQKAVERGQQNALRMLRGEIPAAVVDARGEVQQRPQADMALAFLPACLISGLLTVTLAIIYAHDQPISPQFLGGCVALVLIALVLGAGPALWNNHRAAG